MKENKKYGNIVFIVCVVIVMIAYLSAMKFYDRHQDKGTYPKITVDSDIVTMSVNDKTDKLLEGVHAHDKEDGDITKNIIVEDISEFDENHYRTITYTVFDNDGNVSRMIRLLKYTDYSAPEFTITKPLCSYSYFNESQLKEYVSAFSNVDGNLSSSMVVENVDYNEMGAVVTYSVTDSCGTYKEMKLNFTTTNYPISNKIELSDYLMVVPQGSSIDPVSYITKISGPLGNLNDRMNDVAINNNVDPNTPGTYEIVYTLNTEDGSFGMTKLVVVVR